jgi:hypothetical protein
MLFIVVGAAGSSDTPYICLLFLEMGTVHNSIKLTNQLNAIPVSGLVRATAGISTVGICSREFDAPKLKLLFHIVKGTVVCFVLEW